MHDRDQILANTDLATLADDLLGPHHGPDRSPTWSCPSPDHAQTGRTPPVTIFEGRSGFERWHCHGCGAGGTAIDLVMSAEHVDVREALDTLAARIGMTDMGQPAPQSVKQRCARRQMPDRVADPHGLAAFVDECASRLWSPEGDRVLRWLTEARGVPHDVLRLNRIGADPGARQARPTGMPAAGLAAVLPVLSDGDPIFAQLRTLGSSRLRYLNASAELGPNPRVAVYEPVEAQGSCIVATEGVFDALSAAAAGFRGVALLGASIPDPSRSSTVASQLGERLDALDGRLVVAFDNDEAGQRGSDRLLQILSERRSGTVRIAPPSGAKDLNDWMRAEPKEWPAHLADAMRVAIDISRTPSLGR